MHARPWTLTAKLVATGTTFLLLALASISLTLWVAWKLEGGAAAVNEAGRLRMQTYRLALAVTAREPGDGARVAGYAKDLDASLALVAHGDRSRPLTVPWSPASLEAFARVRAQWAGLKDDWIGGRRTGELSSRADAYVAQIDIFVNAIEHEISRWTAILHLVQMALMALAIASAVAVLYAGYLLVLDPVARLKRGVNAIKSGDLSARVEVDSRDEFGDLSAGFNDMARTLQALYGNLEAKVQEKTRGLEVERQRLADLYEVSAFLSRASTLEELGLGFARQLRHIAGADAAAVRWYDEKQDRYLMLATDNVPAALLEGEACLHAGACACGQGAQGRASRVIPVVDARHAPLGHCRSLGYQGIVCVPVRLHDKVLGELDLFYGQPAQPSPQDRELLEALAAHLASAMESLRAAALEREAAVAEERALLARELHDSIAQSLAFMKIQVRLLRQAMQRADGGAAARIVGELDAGVRESYADVRELLTHFRTRTSDEDIEPALRTTLSKFEHQSGLQTRLLIDSHGVPLAPDVQVQVLHIIQEALSNARKHAQARAVTVRVTGQPCWRFEVRDDGIGFDTRERAAVETHVGLRIMLERAQRIGAQVEVTSSPGHGCAVVVELPRAAAQPAVAGTGTGAVPGAVPEEALT